MFSRTAFYLIFLLTSMVSAYGFVSQTSEDRPFTLIFEDEAPLTVRDGKAEIEFLFRIPEKHHLYRDTIAVEIDQLGVEVETVTGAGESQFDEFRGEVVEVYHGEVAVTGLLTFTKKFVEAQKITGRIAYQGCSERICFRTVRTNFSFDLVKSDAAKSTITKTSGKNDKKGLGTYVNVKDFSEILRQGIFFAVLITFLAGLITGFTPCVLPVIPLTLAFMGVTKQEKFSQRLSHLFIFTLGLALMYASLGVMSAILGKTLGFAYQSEVFLFWLAIFFLAMALWMFGVFKWQVPPRWQNRLVAVQPKGGLKHFYAGLTIGFLAAPCVGPIVAPLLVYISSSKDVILGFMLMLAYALGLSVLFFILGFFSSAWISRFAGKGRIIKNILGVLLLLVSLYYFWVVLKPHSLPRDDFFIDNIAEASTQAALENKNLIVDFYAEWCVPCHEWDKFVWSDEEVRKAVLSGFVPVKIDCTRETESCVAAIDAYRVIGWPTILFLHSNGEEIAETRLQGIVLDKAKFLEYLKDVNAKD